MEFITKNKIIHAEYLFQLICNIKLSIIKIVMNLANKINRKLMLILFKKPRYKYFENCMLFIDVLFV